MEDIKNIENAKARAETFMKNRENRKRNEKYTPGFIEMAVNYLTKPRGNPLEASPQSVLGKKKAKAATTRGKTEAAAKRKMTSAKTSVRNGERDIISLKAESVPKDKNYNVGVSKGGVSFKEAFAHFRKKGDKTFTWNGEKYTTELAKPKGNK